MTEQKILVVEDSEPLRLILAEKLRDEKFTVFEANGGAEGVRIALEEKPDIIVTDVVMFPVDGLEMSKQIRASGEWGANAYIIALTNQNSAEEENRLVNLNLNDYLVKAETSLDEVVAHVKKILKKKK